jgi:dihydrodipicolinate synthase/N-acetylneuraminate lyase
MPAIITPFDDDGSVDLEAHAVNVRLLSAAGIAGFAIGGSNGEGPYLESGDRAALAAVTREVAPDAFVLVGTVAESLRMALAQVGEAADGGADAILATTPTTLVRYRPDSVTEYYEALADAAPVPVFLYSVPRVTAYDLPLDVAIGLAAHHNVAGIKDSSGDLDRARTLVAAPFSVYVGASAIVSSGMAAGARGAITASTNYAPSLVMEVVDSATEGDIGPQERLTTLAKTVEQYGVPGVKYAATRAGLIGGVSRLPLRPPSPDACKAIDAALEAAGL